MYLLKLTELVHLQVGLIPSNRVSLGFRDLSADVLFAVVYMSGPNPVQTEFQLTWPGSDQVRPGQTGIYNMGNTGR